MPDKDWNRKEYKGEMKMKRLSYILLAAMLVAALAVSCTAEVIDDMGLVSVGFEGVRDNGSKGLTVAQAALDVYDSSLTWYYTAQKKAGDNTPATGATVKETKLEGGISTGKLTLSQGRWNFALYGYVGWISEEAKGTLVYKGSADQVEISGKSSKVQIAVSPQKSEEGKGSLVFKNGIVIVDGNKKSFAANYAEYKVLDTESLEPVELKLNEDTRIEGLKSATYEVTVYCKDKDFVYAQASAVVTIYDGLESVISGTLDENTAEAGFGVIKVDAAAGTTSQSQSITDSSEVEYKYGFSPASEGLSDTKTTTIKGSFAKTVEGEVSSLELKVYDRASSAQRFTLSNGEAVIAGFDFTLSNATVNGTVEVSAYIGEGYTKEKLAVVYNGSDAAQPTIVSYDSGVLTFTTTHFSEYYVTTSDACVSNENTKQKYIYLQDAIDNASDGDTIRLLGDVVLENTVVVDKKLTLDLEGGTISNVSDLWNESTDDWSLVSVRGTGNLTITGNGTLKAKEEDCYAVDVQDEVAVLTIENGKFVGNINAVYVFEGSAYIKGGTYSVQQKYSDASKADEFVLNCYDPNYKGKDSGDRKYTGPARIVVTGGKFEKFNPADCYAEGAHTNFVAEGYISVKDEDGISYTVREKRDSDIAMVDGVVYSSLSNAISAAKDKDIVRLLNDFDGTVIIIGKDLMIDFNGYVISGGIGIGCNYDSYWSEGNPSTVVFIDSRENGGITTSDAYGALRIKNGSNVLVKGGSFVAEHSKSYSRVIRLEDSTLEIEGGSFINKSAGSYSRVVEVGLGTECTGDITIKGGCFSSVSDCGVIVYGDSSAVVNLLVEDGSFSTYGNYGWFTDVYGKVTVNDCEFSSDWNQVFNPRKSSSEFNSSNNITINGGVFTLGNGVSSHLGGFVYCNRNLSNAYGYEKGMLELRGGKINYDMHPLILEDSGCSAILDSDGYYVIKLLSKTNV